MCRLVVQWEEAEYSAAQIEKIMRTDRDALADKTQQSQAHSKHGALLRLVDVTNLSSRAVQMSTLK